MELNDQVVRAAIEMGGTATGEHGVGIGNRKFLDQEYGATVDVVAAIKETIDPNSIMNSWKVLPDAE